MNGVWICSFHSGEKKIENRGKSEISGVGYCGEAEAKERVCKNDACGKLGSEADAWWKYFTKARRQVENSEFGSHWLTAVPHALPSFPIPLLTHRQHF